MYLQSLVQRFERLSAMQHVWRSADVKGALGVLATWGESIRQQAAIAAKDHLRRLVMMQRAPSMSRTGALENVALDRSAREVLVPARVMQPTACRMQRGSWPTDTFG